MLDFTNCNINTVIAHQVGNKTNDEDLIISENELDISEYFLKELLVKYFLYSFSIDEFYSFTFSNNNLELNPMFQFSRKIFANRKNFREQSENIAKLLYDTSTHPQIKFGDLFIVSFSNINVDGNKVSGLGVFKSENRHPFLKLDASNKTFSLKYEEGINTDKLDKGCLILDISKNDGYKICVVDKSNKLSEAQFWRESFLNISPCNNEFNQTKQFLNITKNFITKQFPTDFETTKADQIDLLNRSVEYFKTHETFDKQEFEKEVFHHDNIISSFNDFNKSYRQENDIDIADDFEISKQAVKKQERTFKSVLKLDKNFHIYIHGNKNFIEKGVEKDGRKYYKIYYENEA
jgi:hypothetical protein